MHGFVKNRLYSGFAEIEVVSYRGADIDVGGVSFADRRGAGSGRRPGRSDYQRKYGLHERAAEH